MNPQTILSQHGKSFAWAARLLSRDARVDATLLYAFARTADDWADEAHLGPLHERLRVIDCMQRDALRPLAAESGLARQVGLMLSARQASTEVLSCLLDSLKQDAHERVLHTELELMQFAYGVAGTVGQLMRPILGAPAHAERYAMTLGIAMQLTNIARDVVEDAGRGRCYIPMAWGLDMKQLATPADETEREQAFIRIERLLAMADVFYEDARQGFAWIPWRNRRAIDVAAALYQGIGHKIRQRGRQHYWDGRCSLTAVEKIRIMWRCLTQRSGLLGYRGTMSNASSDVLRSTMQHLAQTPGFPALG
jgi:15-cis-phytoene synthase